VGCQDSIRIWRAALDPVRIRQRVAGLPADGGFESCFLLQALDSEGSVERPSLWLRGAIRAIDGLSRRLVCQEAPARKIASAAFDGPN